MQAFSLEEIIKKSGERNGGKGKHLSIVGSSGFRPRMASDGLRKGAVILPNGQEVIISHGRKKEDTVSADGHGMKKSTGKQKMSKMKKAVVDSRVLRICKQVVDELIQGAITSESKSEGRVAHAKYSKNSCDEVDLLKPKVAEFLSSLNKMEKMRRKEHCEMIKLSGDNSNLKVKKKKLLQCKYFCGIRDARKYILHTNPQLRPLLVLIASNIDSISESFSQSHSAEISDHPGQENKDEVLTMRQKFPTTTDPEIAITFLIQKCKEYEIPVAIVHSRRKLGVLLGKKGKVSVVAVMNVDGSEKLYDEVKHLIIKRMQTD